jgi:hypothetical protein
MMTPARQSRAEASARTDPGVVNPDELGGELVERAEGARRSHGGPSVFDSNRLGEPRVVALGGVEEFEPVQDAFRHVAGDADRAAIELVGNEDAAAGARPGRPPANAIGLLLSEVGEDVRLQRGPARQLES